MYTRKLTLPNHSFFLFGPRSTGKTTWLKSVLPEATWVNLLLDRDFLPLAADAGRFTELVEAAPHGWVVIDEVQKLPNLLNEVHHLIQSHGAQYQFALSGSSARKLRRLQANLLAGRVIYREFYPLTMGELAEDFSLDLALEIGTLPAVVGSKEYAYDILRAYVNTYLQQEISQETLVRDIAPFARFLEVAAITNGQIVNISSVARDAQIGRTTAERYYEILCDTLIGFWLPAWNPRLRVKETTRSKFFFFDTGVARAAAGVLRAAVSPLEVGVLFETLVLNELRAWISYTGSAGKLSYWNSGSGKEVDFIWSHAQRNVGIEVKHSKVWRREYGQTISELKESGKISKAFGLYTGREKLKFKHYEVLPFEDFADSLYRGLFD